MAKIIKLKSDSWIQAGKCEVHSKKTMVHKIIFKSKNGDVVVSVCEKVWQQYQIIKSIAQKKAEAKNKYENN